MGIFSRLLYIESQGDYQGKLSTKAIISATYWKGTRGYNRSSLFKG